MSANDTAALRTFSARWGNDPALVQGAGGNTSLKAGGRLIVKASGTRLAHAADREIFVDIDLASTVERAESGTLTGAGLRPSIEASLHAIMPQTCVAHLHPVELLAYAVRATAEADLSSALQGFGWAFVPYHKPGPTLALAVAAELQRTEADVLVLGNHGLLVGGPDFPTVSDRIKAVLARLCAVPRTACFDPNKLAVVAERLDLEPARFADAHLSALDPINLGFATQGSLYPDHVVFLGRGANVLAADGPTGRDGSLLYLAPGVGALLPRGASNDAHELAACLGAVVSRIPQDAEVCPLSTADEDGLLNWEAETYRQSLARAAASAGPSR